MWRGIVIARAIESKLNVVDLRSSNE